MALMVVSFLQMGTTASAIPSSLSIQGALSNAAGQPAAGNYSLTTTLYDASNAGNVVWSDTFNVTVDGGVFDIALGNDLANPLLANYFTDHAQMWLGVTVEAGPGVGEDGDPELPRQPLTTVGYAFATQFAASAGTAEGLSCANCVDLADLAFDPVTEAELNLALGQLQIPSGSCNEGEAVVAIGVDGTVSCGPAGNAILPPDGLNEVSNDLLTNQFVDNYASGGNIPIPDFHAPGITDTVTLPDAGTAQSLNVAINLTNSSLATVTVKLFAPDGTEYLLFDKDQPGTDLGASYPNPTDTITGDLTTWVGENPKGDWILNVIDLGQNGLETDGQINSWSITVQTLSNQKIASSGDIYMQGNQVKSLGSPTEEDDAANKKYVDDAIAAVDPSMYLKSGTVLTRWGTSTCPAGFEKLFDGLTFGPHHDHSATSDLSCLRPENQGGEVGGATSSGGDLLYPLSVGNNYGTGVPYQKLIRCAKCFTPARAPCWRLEGGITCPGSFEAVYSGLLFGGHYQHSGQAQRICLDVDNFQGDQGNSGDYIYPTRLQESTGSSGFTYTSSRSVRCAWCCRP